MQDISARFEYSEKYYDDQFEYRHVTLPKEMLKQMPKDKLRVNVSCELLKAIQA